MVLVISYFTPINFVHVAHMLHMFKIGHVAAALGPERGAGVQKSFSRTDPKCISFGVVKEGKSFPQINKNDNIYS